MDPSNLSTARTGTGRAARAAFTAYGAACYLLFLGTFMYAVGFIGNLAVPRTLDAGGPPAPPAVALLINALLLSAFVVQHTVMARPAFKAWWTRICPPPIERATFVLATCGVLILLFWQWRPIAGVVWSVENPAGRALLRGLSAAGWCLVLYSSFLIDHFELFGLRQVIRHLRNQAHTPPRFVTPWLYRVVRNPLMLGFLIAFWASPEMTLGHLQFAVMTTGYIFFGVMMEERDLLVTLGGAYARYRASTPMLLPWPRPTHARLHPLKSPAVLPEVASRA